ncbi:4514_t:CDS:2 [Acaulospora morrowiae]|uniref:4514_t:CDS:1 n=1 Tax=Acaulospora morrowiae TaxID=94023 RepID=A0A9N8WHC0_9GLOM|nr:4514_t:CDS:2 [Acaulospora morrowiae]
MKNSNNTPDVTEDTSNSDDTSEQTVLQNKNAPATDVSNNVSNSDEPNNVLTSDISDNALNSDVCLEETKSASPIPAETISLEEKEENEFLNLRYKEQGNDQQKTITNTSLLTEDLDDSDEIELTKNQNIELDLIRDLRNSMLIVTPDPIETPPEDIMDNGQNPDSLKAMSFNVSGSSTSVPVIPSSDLPTIEEVREFNAEELNEFLKGRLNGIDNHIDTLTAQEVDSSTFLDFTTTDFERWRIPGSRPAKKQKLGNLLFTNILDVILNLRKTLPESLRDDIETMTEEQEIKQEEVTSNLIQYLDRKPLAVIQEHVLYVQKSYEDLYHIVTNENCHPKFLISGTSGVGKLCFLIYLLIRFLCNRTNAIVIFKARDDNFLYCFENSNIFVGYFEEFSERLYNPKTWYLVDGTVPKNVLARTVVSASSKSIKDRGFQDVFPEVPQDLMLDLSNEAGGVPIYVLDMPAFIIRLENMDKQTILSNQDEIKKVSLERVEQAFKEIIVTLFTGGLTLSTENNITHGPLVVFLTKSKKKLKDSRWNNLFLKIQDSDDPSSSRGIMFESHVLHLFKLGVKLLNQKT